MEKMCLGYTQTLCHYLLIKSLEHLWFEVSVKSCETNQLRRLKNYSVCVYMCVYTSVYAYACID